MRTTKGRGTRSIASGLLVMLLLAAAFNLGANRSSAQLVESFESGFGPWVADFNYDGAYFSVTISSIYAYDGILSVAMESHSLPQPTYPEMTVWIERTIQVPPSTLVTLGVTFWLYSEGVGVSPRDVVAYIGNSNPETYPIFTTIGQTDQVGDAWYQYSHSPPSFISPPSGTVYVAIGFYNPWSAGAGPKSYYFDLVDITGLSNDFTPPDITDLLPLNNTIINTATPIISANYSDPSGINLSSVRLWVDGLNVTSLSTVWSDRVEYVPSSPLSEGIIHNVNISVMDDCINHNVGTANWSFSIDATPPATVLSIGQPNYTSAGTTYVTSTAQFALSASDGTGTGVSGTFYRTWSQSSGWTLLSPYSGAFTLSGADGTRYIEYNSTDNIGNPELPKNSSATTELYLDNGAPVTGLSMGAPQQAQSGTTYFTSATQFTLSSGDGSGSGVKGIWYRIWSQASGWSSFVQYAGPFTISGQDGTRYIEYNSTDNLDNMEGPSNYSSILIISLDNTPPTTDLAIGVPQYQSPGTTYFTSAASVTLDATDPGCGVQSTWYRTWSGQMGWSAPIPYSTPFTMSGLDGPRYIEYNSTDCIGNAEAPKNYTLTSALFLDNSPPVTVLTIGTPQFTNASSLFVNSSTQFTLSSLDNSGVGSISYSIDGGAPTAYSGQFNLVGEGARTIHYNATDVLGNSEAPKSKTVIVDDTAPVSSAPGFDPVNNTNVSSSFTSIVLSASDGAGSGVDSIRYGVDDQTCPLIYNAAFVLGVSAEGAHTVYFRSVDKLGNQESIRSIRVFLDATQPTADAGDDITATPGDLVELDGRDSSDSQGGTGIANYTWTFVYDGDTVTLYGSQVDFEFKIPGNYQVTLTVTDGVGNTDTDKLTVKVEEDAVQFPWWILAVVLALVVLMLLLLVLLARRRRKEEAQMDEDGSAPGDAELEDGPEEEPGLEEEPEPTREVPRRPPPGGPVAVRRVKKLKARSPEPEAGKAEGRSPPAGGGETAKRVKKLKKVPASESGIDGRGPSE